MSTVITGICNTYRQEVLKGIHQEGDVYKAALIIADPFADYGPLTANYNELDTDQLETAGGYVRPGFALTTTYGVHTDINRQWGWMHFADIVVAVATFATRGVLIYNSSRTGRAVAVVALTDAVGNPLAPAGESFTLDFPSIDSNGSQAFIRFGIGT